MQKSRRGKCTVRIYAPDKEKKHFIVGLISFQNIKIVLDVKEVAEIFNYKNEYKQVLLNLLSNAKEALTKEEIKEPKIEIFIDKNHITIKDNGAIFEIKF